MAKLNKYQMVDFQGWKGLTKNNHLSAAFALAPQKATNLMVQLLAYNGVKNLETFLSSIPTKSFDDDSEYTWDVVSSSRRNIPLVEARDEEGKVVGTEGTIGAGTAPFYLVFAENWFADGRIFAVI